MARARIVAVDFDGTIVEHRFPNIGRPLPYAIETLKKLREKGVRVFLYTMRDHPDLSKYPHIDIHTGEYIPQDCLQEAIDYCKENGLEFDGINWSPEQFSNSTKQYAHVYIDDAALGCPLTMDGYVNWIEVIKYLIRPRFLTLDDAQDILGAKDLDETFDKLGIYHGHKPPVPANYKPSNV